MGARLRAAESVLALILLCACAQAEPIERFLSPNTSQPANTEPPISPTSGPAITARLEETRPFFQGPLTVIVSSPADNATVSASPVEISAEAEPGTVVNFNDQVILVDSNRTFHVQIDLELGINLIEITASDSIGQEDFAYLTLFYEPQP